MRYSANEEALSCDHVVAAKCVQIFTPLLFEMDLLVKPTRSSLLGLVVKNKTKTIQNDPIDFNE